MKMSKKNICPADQCTGCKACFNICACNAIEFIEDENFCDIAVIKQESCKNCGLCSKVCPQLKHSTLNYPRECYAAWMREEERPRASSSGGIAYALTYTLIQAGGIVFAPCWKGNLLKHTQITSIDELNLLCGSKYVQSDVGLTFQEAKQYLLKSQPVLYIGTPCQIAGLKNYLGFHSDYLLTVDLVCHGAPPKKFLQDYMKAFVNPDKVDNITFRDKKGYRLSIYSHGRRLIQHPFRRDWYLLAFMYSLISRESCYQCVYAKKERVGDITLGDFWGLDRSTLKSPSPIHPSLVLINTENGKKWFELIKKSIVWESRIFQEAVNGNRQLSEPAVAHQDRRAFLSSYSSLGIISAIKATAITDFYDTYIIIFFRFLTRGVRFIKRIPKRIFSH